MSATDQFLSALLGWSILAAIVVAIGTVVIAGMFTAVSIPIWIIAL